MADEDTTKGTEEEALDADKVQDPDPEAQVAEGPEGQPKQEVGTMDQ